MAIESGGLQIMLYHIGLWIGKIAGRLSQLLGKSGTSIPGMVALKIHPNILERLANQVDHIVLITGTNGKTTTSNLISSIFSETDYKYINNEEGSNLISGITSSFIKETNLFGTIKNVQYAIIEVDEITLIKVLKYVHPDMIVITNFFRDQLDRFGEIDELIKKMEDAIRPVDTKLLLNGDDPFSYRLKNLGKETVYFGLNKDSYVFEKHEMSDSKFCPDCGKELMYDHNHYGQLGYYRCDCGFERPNVKHEIEKIEVDDYVTVHYQGNPFTSQLKGDYNAYNLAAAIASATELGISTEWIKRGIEKYILRNGRMQTFSYKDYRYTLNLAKNHQGVNSTLSSYLKNEEPKQIVLFLNDLGADGTDVSWIWDADYELLNRPDITRVICSGRRAYDMAIRIQYAGVLKEKIEVYQDIQEAVNQATKQPMNTYLISTYTALNHVRKALESHPNISTETTLQRRGEA